MELKPKMSLADGIVFNDNSITYKLTRNFKIQHTSK